MRDKELALLTTFCGLMFFLAVFVAVATPGRLACKVSAPMVMAGNSERVTCSVARNEENRGLTIGIENYTSSFAQIDGEAGRVTYEVWFKKVPCEAGAAYCQLVDSRGRIMLSHASITVAGCDESH